MTGVHGYPLQSLLQTINHLRLPICPPSLPVMAIILGLQQSLYQLQNLHLGTQMHFHQPVTSKRFMITLGQGWHVLSLFRLKVGTREEYLPQFSVLVTMYSLMHAILRPIVQLRSLTTVV